MSLGTYAAALHTAHTVADHWVQTDWQAQNKARHSRQGWKALLEHVGSYVATQAVCVTAAGAASGTMPRPGHLALALAVSGVCHGWADRREPLKRLADRLGKNGFYQAGTPPVGHGGYALDQAWHHATSVFLPALILAYGQGSDG